MDVNWYVVESIAHQRLAELRVSVARCRRAAAEGPRRRRRAPLGLALLRAGRRLLGRLDAARTIAWRLLD